MAPFRFRFASRIRGWRILSGAAGIAAVTYVATRADWAAGGELLSKLGIKAPLVLFPFFFAMLCGTAAWRITLARIGHSVQFLPLLRMRIVAEALVTAIPGGSVVSETLKPFWLKRRFQMPLDTATASVALTKAFIIQSEGAYLLLAMGFAYPILSAENQSFSGPMLWIWQALPAAGLFLLVFGSLLLRWMEKGSAVRVLHWLLQKVPLAVLRTRLHRQELFFAATSGGFAKFFARGRAATLSIVFLFSLGHWLFEAAETYLILNLMGLPATFPKALFVESILSAVRAMMFFLPGGLGAQEVAAFFLLGIIGVPDPKGAATALSFTKRSKEVFWIVTALCLSFVKRR